MWSRIKVVCPLFLLKTQSMVCIFGFFKLILIVRISDKGQAAHISKGKSCIENKVTELKMENCHPLLITQRWTFTKSDTPQPLLLPEANLIFECYGIKPVHPNIYVKGDRCTLEKGSLSEACLKGPPERCNVELRVLVK